MLFLAIVLAVFGSCSLPQVGTTSTARATFTFKLTGSPSGTDASLSDSSTTSRLLKANASWVRLTLDDGSTSQSFTQAISYPTFTVAVKIYKSYTIRAEAGTTSGNVETILYSGSTNFKASENQTVAINLLPSEPEAGWTEITADNYTIELDSLGGQASVTYRVQLGSFKRWYINSSTGLGTSLQLYVQNEDGSAVTPAAYAADRLVVEKSQLSAGATSFLLTLYNDAPDPYDAIALNATRDTNVGTLLFAQELATIGTSSSPSDMTYLDGKLYVAMNANYSVVSLNADGTDEATFLDGSDYGHATPWGLTTDGTDIYIAFQYGDPDGGAAVKVNASTGDIAWSSTLSIASGIATLGEYAYFTSNSLDQVYRVLKDSSDSALAPELFAGDGAAVRENTDNPNGLNASFWAPAGICSDGNFLYVVDCGSRTVRRIDPATGEVTTFAGSGDTITDGVGTAASFSGLNHIVSDGTYLYLTDANTIRRITIASRKVETIFTLSFSGGGLVRVGDVIYVADTTVGSNKIYKIN